MPLRVSVRVPEPVAVRPAPVGSLADRLPLEISTTTVRAVELVPSAPPSRVMWPPLVDTVNADGRFKVGRLNVVAVPVTVLTVIALAAESPPVMPLLWLLRVTLTAPLPLALTLPAAR